MLRIFLCIAMLCWPAAGYSKDIGKENLVKAVVLYNFAKFTDWPAETFNGPDAPIFFSATGKTMSETLGKLEGKQVQKRDVKLRHFDTDPQYYSHILFISSSESKSAAKILSGIENKPILTVSDIPGFIHLGGMIGLIKKDGRIRFEINFDATRKAGLRISSQLLLLATTVVRDQGEVR